MIKQALVACFALAAVWSAAAGDVYSPCHEPECRRWDRCDHRVDRREPCWIEPWLCCPRHEPWYRGERAE